MPEFRAHRTITGGLRLAANKSSSTAAPINRTFRPQQLVIPMAGHKGSPAVPIVAVGQRVLKGELIGEPGAPPSAAVHASSSGMVIGVEQRLEPRSHRLISSDCVIIEPDGRDEPITYDAGRWPEERSARLDAMRRAGLVGLGGAVFPTAEKLQTEGACELLIVNGAECEPYISCDDMLMRESPEEIVRGTLAMMEVLGAQRAIVAIEGDKPAALKAMTQAVRALDPDRVQVAELPTVYPAGGERQLVEILTGQEVPSGRYPIDVGCVCQNVGTAYALDRYIRTGEPVITRIVSVNGTGVSRPQNVEVPIGAPIDELIRFCGGYRGDVDRLILGGSMMGYALPTDELPVTKATNCIIAARRGEVRQSYEAWPCIRCGDCMAVCPARLLPQELLRSAKARDFEQLDVLGLGDCIECGCCDVICPSQIPLTESFRNAKHAWALHQRHERLAAESEERHRKKEARLKRQQEETDRRQEELKTRVSSDSDSRREQIEAAVRRARSGRGDSGSS